MITSPGGPPFMPRPPCPLRRMREPESVPGGTVIMTRLRVRTSPAPLHVGHRSLGIWPRPRHIGQGRVTANPPWPNEIVPLPLHSGQVRKVAPGAPPLPWHVGHSSVTSRSTGTLPPVTAVRNGISSVLSTLSPRSGPGAPPRPPRAFPPNIEPNRSPRPPRPPTSKSSKRKVPEEPPVEPE